MRERHCRHRRRQQQQNSPDIIHTVTSIITFIVVIYTISNTSISSIRYTSYTTINTRFINSIYPSFRRVKDGIITTTTTIPFVVGFTYNNHLRKYRNYHFTFDRKINNHLLLIRSYPHCSMSKESISTSSKRNVEKINDDDNNTSGENDDGIDGVMERPQQQEQLGQPIYITIGPPCSGKTTWIQKRNQLFNTSSSKILDICIDEQPGVYYSIPIEYFIPPNNKDNKITKIQTNGNNNKKNDNNNNDMNTITTTILPTDIIFGKTIHERINEQKELCTIIQRFQNITSKDEFYKSIVTTPSSSSSSSSILYQVVEDIISEYQNDDHQNITLPKQIDLFVFESIFQRSTSSNISIIDDTLSGIERTKQLLYNTSSSIPIAWGNTNTRPNDYVEALKLASLLHRPVYFVVYYDDNDDENPNWKLDLFDLSVENGLYGLIRRNILRFLKTGRYIPSNIIMDMRDRVNQMIRFVLTLSNENDYDEVSIRNITKFEFHKRLSQLAGYYMNDDRTVTLMVQNKKLAGKPMNKVSNQQSIHSSDKRPVKVQEQEQKHNVGTSMKRRPWDRPSSAVRGYNGQFDNQQRKVRNKSNNNGDV